MTMLPLPKGVTELLFDGDPATPNRVIFAVRVFPETEAVLVYPSLETCPAQCGGPLTYLTVMTNSGRIYVQRLSKYSHFEITIVPGAESGATNISLGAESSPPALQGNQAPMASTIPNGHAPCRKPYAESSQQEKVNAKTNR